MNQEDTNRLNELKTKIFGFAARRLIRGDKKPFEIEAREIEQHRGRREKAVRLLKCDGCLEFLRTKKDPNSYRDSETPVYSILKFDTDSQQYAVVPTFTEKWYQFYQDIFLNRYNIHNQDEYDVVGYRTTSDLKHGEAISTWWNKDLYDIVTVRDANNNDKSTHVYPKALRVIRIRAMLRAIIEHSVQVNYHDQLAEALGYPKGSLKEEESFTISYRNVAHNIQLLTKPVMEEFVKEYQYRIEFFKSLAGSLQAFMDKVDQSGGYEVTVRKFRKDRMEALLVESPLLINAKYKEEYGDAGMNRWINSCCARFLLRHSDEFNYDILYGSDESVSYLKSDTVELDHETFFKPEENEVRLFDQPTPEEPLEFEGNLFQKDAA